MKIGFVTALPTVDFKDTPFVVLAPLPYTLTVPYLSGYLEKNGYKDIKQYELHSLFGRNLQKAKHMVVSEFYMDDGVTDLYLQSEHKEIQESMSEIIDFINFEPADFFCFSFAYASGVIRNIDAITNLNLCMIAALKRKFPESKTIIGGKTVFSGKGVHDFYVSTLERCPDLDFAVMGQGEKPLLDIFRGTKNGEYQGSLKDCNPYGNGLLFGTVEQISKKSNIVMPNLEEPVVPAFQNANDYKSTGKELMSRYGLEPHVPQNIDLDIEKPILLLPCCFVTGCTGGCAFCSNSRLPVSSYPIPEVIKIIATLQERHETSFFVFYNTCINWSYDYALEFTQALIDAQLNITWTDSLNTFKVDERLVSNLRESGFVRADIGAESPSNKLLKYIKKPLTQERLIKMLELLHQYGIWNHINLIVGLPFETEEDLKLMTDFIENTKDIVDGYSLNEHYVIGISKMGLRPEKYNIRVEPDLCLIDGRYRFKYEEIGGRTWPQIQEWHKLASERITEAMRAAKGSRQYLANFDIHLLLWLYSCLGHDRKDDIKTIIKNLYTIPEKKKETPKEKKIDIKVQKKEELPKLRKDLTEVYNYLHKKKRAFFGCQTKSVVITSENQIRLLLEHEKEEFAIGIRSVKQMPQAFLSGMKYSVFFFDVNSPNIPQRNQAIQFVFKMIERNV